MRTAAAWSTSRTSSRSSSIGDERDRGSREPRTARPAPNYHARVSLFDPPAILGPDGPVAARLERFEHRPQQMTMARAVAANMDARRELVIEAPTGIGKSFAYLVPAIQRILDHKERVVVVTHTINLQEQLVDKDIPLLQAIAPEQFNAVLVKGRNNYVSLRRLRLAGERKGRLFGDESSLRTLHDIEDWAYETRDGTRASLPQLERADVWDHVRSDTHNCMGRACPSNEKCFYQAARRRMENGDLLICNHAIFFRRSCAARPGRGLPAAVRPRHPRRGPRGRGRRIRALRFGAGIRGRSPPAAGAAQPANRPRRADGPAPPRRSRDAARAHAGAGARLRGRRRSLLRHARRLAA